MYPPAAYNRRMPRISCFAVVGVTMLGLGACGAAPGPAPGRAGDPAPAPRERLLHVVEQYWDERNPSSDIIDPQRIADSLSVERRYLEEITAIPRSALDPAAKLIYDAFKWRRALAVEGATYPAELMPINPFGGAVLDMAADAADTRDHPFTTVPAYEDWLRRVAGHVRWTRQAIANMREGMRRGYTSPRAVVERMLPLLERLGADDSGNVFYTPLRSMPVRIKEPERARLTRELTRAVSQDLLPATRELHDFLLRDYLPRARAGLALTDLPLGRSWYAYRMKRAVGGAATATEIHQIGIAEVERLRQRMQTLREALPAAVPSELPRAIARDRAALLDAYQDLASQVAAAVPNVFAAMPKAALDFRVTEFAADPALPLRYQAAGPAGSPPAVLYISVPAAVSVAGYLREAVPGLHYQSALQREKTELPRFLRFGSEPDFVEGWSLYAATLGDDMGLYPDSASRLSALAGQLQCAAALVIDTGVHAQGWTRGQALDYLRAHLAVDDAQAQALVDAVAATPADALACKMGELKIQALRLRAQQVLGAKFDIRDFHSQILEDGALPLDILEAKVKAWIEAAR